MLPPDNYAATDIGMAVPATPATLTAGVRATVAYPLGMTAQWVVVNNSSPYTVQVSQGQFLGQVAAFTVDKMPVRGATAITLLPVAGAGLIPAGTDSTAYLTFYGYEPDGSFPAAIGSGSTPIAPLVTLRGNAAVTMTGGVTLSDFTVPTWAQAIAVRIDDNGLGTANGWQVAVNDTTVPSTQAIAAIGAFQWFYVPVQGRPTSVTITPLTNGVAGGSSIGPVRVQALAGPIVQPIIGGFGDSATASRPGLTTNNVVIGPGATAALIARPPTGIMIRVTSIDVIIGAAAAAVATQLITGITSGLRYWQDELPAAIPIHTINAQTFLVGHSGQADPAEGIQGTNNASVNATYVVTYDLVPPPIHAGAGW